MEGGDGNDTYTVDATGDVIVETLTGGSDTVNSSVTYTLSANIEALKLTAGDIDGTGNDQDNTITGSTGNNVLTGMGGADLINAGAGNDTLYGDDGADRLNGEDGNDTISGGAGSDILSGGTGTDTFVFTSTNDSIITAMDQITDFTHGADKIDLAAIDAISGTGANDAFSWIGATAFSHTAGELRYASLNGVMTVQGDTDGDGIADIAIKITNSAALTSGDFFF